MISFILHVIFIVSVLITQVFCYSLQYGIMNVRPKNFDEYINYNDTEKYCIEYITQTTKLPRNESLIEYHEVADGTSRDSCDDDAIIHFEDHFIFVDAFDNCSVTSRASKVEELGGAGTLFVMTLSKTPDIGYTNMSLLFAFVSNRTYNMVMNQSDDVEVGLYSPDQDFSPNISLLVIWILAVFTVFVGSYWSGCVKHRMYLIEQSGHDDGDRRNESAENVQPVVRHEDMSLNLTPHLVLLFVFLMCAMLLCLYFLYDYLVYAIIGLFCIASLGGVYSCLEPLLNYIHCGTCSTPYFNIYIIKGQVEVKQILLFLFSLGLVITWFILRKASYAWILQDILGIAFSINMLKVIRLPSLKICTILLSLLFFYDIFFVFISPYLTKSGESIMVAVAQGGSSSEQLPMVLKVPNFSYSETAEVCQLPPKYNILGFGDILVPGLLISFVHGYDLKVGTRCHLYFFMNIVAYGLGLLTTFVGLFMMEFAQPALLYLVPFTLLPTVIVAASRGELTDMWRGDSEKLPLLSKSS